MIEYLQSRPANPERLRLLSFYGHTSKFKKSPVRRKLCWFNYDGLIMIIYFHLSKFGL